MPHFEHESMTSNGEMRIGKIEAPTEADAQSALVAEGLFVTRLRKIVGPDGASDEGSPRSRDGHTSSGCFSASSVLFLLFLLSITFGLLMR